MSFFVLGPGGVELNQTQLERGQNVVNYSVPVENQGHLYPLTLSQVQYNITLEIDANGQWGGNFRDTSLNFRDRLFQVLQPGTPRSTCSMGLNPEFFQMSFIIKIQIVTSDYFDSFENNTICCKIIKIIIHPSQKCYLQRKKHTVNLCVYFSKSYNKIKRNLWLI